LPPALGSERLPWETLRSWVAEDERGARPATAADLLAELGRGAIRDVWIASGPADDRFERVLAHAALAGGWAVLREPALPVPAATLLWARPTLIAGRAAELAELLAAAAAEAPRWGARRWLRRRLARLRALVVPAAAGAASADLPERLAERLEELGLDARLVRVVVELGPLAAARGADETAIAFDRPAELPDPE
jgi:hypothetical protein